MLRLPLLLVVAGVALTQTRSSHAFLTSKTSSTARSVTTLDAAASDSSTSSTGNNTPARNANGKTEPTAVGDRDELVLALQSEIAALYASMAEQKDAYQTTLAQLETDADVRVQQAQRTVDALQEEYNVYKEEITGKLENAATPAEMARLSEEVDTVRDHAATLKGKLDDALAQLRQNREDRKNLMGEMVALKESYIDKLNDLEDQLEFVQDERVRDQQDAAKQMEALQQESKQKIQQAIEDGRKQVDELTLAYTQRIARKDEELSQAKFDLDKARQTLQQKDETIQQLETDAQSIRKLMRKSFGLVKRRIGKRLGSLVPGKKSPQSEEQSVE